MWLRRRRSPATHWPDRITNMDDIAAPPDETPLQQKLREYRSKHAIRVTSEPVRVRFAEFASPALPRIIEQLILHVVFGLIITFLVGMLPLLILEEDAIQLGREWRQMDALGRYGVGIVFLAGVAMVLPLMAANFWASWSIRRAIEAQAENRPEVVATPAQLRRDPDASRTTLRIGMLVFVGIGAVIGGFLLVMGLIGLADEVPESIEAVVIGVVLVVIGALCWWAARVLKKARTPTMSPRKTWSGDLARVRKDMATTAAEQERRELPKVLRVWRTLARVLAVVQYALISLTAMFAVLGVMARQPCRTCEPRTFGPGIEATLDRFWILVGVMAILAGVTILAHGILAVLASALTRRELVRRIDVGEAALARPDDKVLNAVVAETSGPWGQAAHLSGLWMVVPLVLGAVWLLVAAVGHTVYADFITTGWTFLVVGAALLVVHVVCLVADEVSDPAMRDKIREAWPVDDRQADRAGHE